VSVFAGLVGRGLLRHGRVGERREVRSWVSSVWSVRRGFEEAFERGILGLEMGIWLVLAGE